MANSATRAVKEAKVDHFDGLVNDAVDREKKKAGIEKRAKERRGENTSNRGLDRVVVGKKNGYLMQERVDALREKSFVVHETSAENASKGSKFERVPFRFFWRAATTPTWGRLKRCLSF